MLTQDLLLTQTSRLCAAAQMRFLLGSSPWLESAGGSNRCRHSEIESNNVGKEVDYRRTFMIANHNFVACPERSLLLVANDL